MIKIKLPAIAILTFAITTQVLADVDSDGDGYTDQKEELLGTDPNFNEFQTTMPVDTGISSEFLSKSYLDSRLTSNVVQAVATPNNKFLIGRVHYRLYAYRISDTGSLSPVTSTITSDYISTDHNDIALYSSYPLAVSPNGQYLAVYNPTLPRNKRSRIYNSNIELYRLTNNTCSTTSSIGLTLIQRFTIPNQGYNSVISSLQFASDSRALYVSGINGLSTYSISESGLSLLQNFPNYGGSVAVLKNHVAVLSGQIFEVHSPSGYLMNPKSFDPGIYSTSDLVANTKYNTFWSFREGDDWMDATYINEFDTDGSLIRQVSQPIGTSIQMNSRAVYVPMEDEEYGGLRVYGSNGNYIGRTYKALDPNTEDITEVTSTPDGKWLFISRPSGTYTYSGANVAKSHEDTDNDGVLDINDDYPLDPNQQ